MAQTDEQSLDAQRRRQMLTVRVLTPERSLFEGEALAVTATSNVGTFSILPQHANFISLIRGTIVVHTSQQAAHELPVEGGVLFCRNNKVDVYVGLTPGPGGRGRKAAESFTSPRQAVPPAAAGSGQS